jgi:MFS family permease
MLWGHLTDRFGSRGFAPFAALTATGALAFLVLPQASGGAFVVLVIVAFATGWAWPGLMTYTVVHANPWTVAASSAITQAGVFLGAGLGPLLLGAVIERWSFGGAWITAALGLVLATGIVTAVGLRTR